MNRHGTLAENQLTIQKKYLLLDSQSELLSISLSLHQYDA